MSVVVPKPNAAPAAGTPRGFPVKAITLAVGGVLILAVLSCSIPGNKPRPEKSEEAVPGKTEGKAEVEAKSKSKEQPAKKQSDTATRDPKPAPEASAPDPKKIQEDAAPEQVPQAETSAPPQRAAPVKTSEELDKQIRTLIRALASRSQQRSAQEKLVEIGPAAVPALIHAMKNKETFVRIAAAYVLWEIGPAAEAAVPALIQALKDRDRGVRYYSAVSDVSCRLAT